MDAMCTGHLLVAETLIKEHKVGESNHDQSEIYVSTFTKGRYAG